MDTVTLFTGGRSVESQKIPYLCGGTLFFLLVQAKKPRAKAKEREKGIKDHLADPEMMEGLIQAITGSSIAAYGDSLKKNTSQFRECRIDGSIYIPFNNQAAVSSYNYDVANNYDAVLSRMIKFADDFLDPAKTEWLVRVLLDVIEQDSGIGNDARFFIQSDGTSLLKSDLLAMERIELQPFLIGIVHYLLMYRSDNISGRATLEAWTVKPSERAERKLKKGFSLGASRSVAVDWRASSPRVPVDGLEKNHGQQEENAEYIEAEVVEDCTGNTGKDEGNPANQSVFINNGSGVQIGVNYGTINLSPFQGTKS